MNTPLYIEKNYIAVSISLIEWKSAFFLQERKLKKKKKKSQKNLFYTVMFRYVLLVEAQYLCSKSSHNLFQSVSFTKFVVCSIRVLALV